MALPRLTTPDSVARFPAGMATPTQILLVGFGSEARALAGRLLLLEMRGLLAEDLESAGETAQARGPGVALIHSDAIRDASAVRELAAAARGDGGMVLIASGPRPSDEALRVMRRGGISLALFEPFSDGELRFVLNRALYGEDTTRRETRVPTDLDATVHSATGEKRVTVYNLSAGGAYLETLRPTGEGGNLRVRLPLPGGEVELPARVVGTNVPGNLTRPNLPMGMGVQFQDADADATQAVATYVRERETEYRI